MPSRAYVSHRLACAGLLPGPTLAEFLVFHLHHHLRLLQEQAKDPSASIFVPILVFPPMPPE